MEFLITGGAGSVGQVLTRSLLERGHWEEVAGLIIEVTDSSSSLKVIPAKEWKGTPFLADVWELSTQKAERGYRPV